MIRKPLAAALAALTLTAALTGVAGAQEADPCQTHVDRAAELQELADARVPGAQEFTDKENRELQKCRHRIAVAEHEQLVSERAEAGRAYLAVNPETDTDDSERQAARDAWRSANEAVNQHEAENGLAPQPHNDGISDFYRYWCLERNGKPGNDNLSTNCAAGPSRPSR